MKSDSPGYAARSGSGYDSATAKGSVETKGDPLSDDRGLWTKATQLLPEDESKFLDFDLASPDQILSIIELRIADCKRKQWSFRKSNGEVVILRNVFEKIAGSIRKVQKVGDAITQYNPAQAALPWAGVHFVLEIVISDSEKYRAMIEGLDVISRSIVFFTEYEKSLRSGTSERKIRLEKSIVTAYSTILRYFLEAKRYWDSSTGKRALKSLTSESKVDELLGRLAREEEHAYKFFSLVQEENEAKNNSNLTKAIQDIQATVGETNEKLKNTRGTLIRRLTPIYTDENFENNLSLRSKGTANWIFERIAFKDWALGASEQSKLFWIYGPPGFGKSVLAASIIHQLQTEQQTSLAYFFCVSEDHAKSEPCAILTSWIAQLMQQSVEAVDIVCRVFSPDEQHVISWVEKWKCFRALCRELPSCTFVIDGFDECKSINKTSKYYTDDGRSKFLRELLQEAAETKSRILLISRDCADVRAEVHRAEGSNLNIAISSYKITEEDTRRDIQIFSKQVVDLKLSNKLDAFRTDIAERAASKSEGMFLWIHLLSRHFDPSRNSKQLENIVAQTPAGIEQAYEQDQVKISQMEVGQREEAIAILRWVLFAFRPLRIKELAEALILQWKPEGFVYPTDMLPDNWDRGYVDADYINGVIRQPLGSLIELRSLSKHGDLSDQTVHLTHFSAKEYLLQRRIANILTFSDIRSENRLLGKLCLQYLCYDVFADYEMEGETSLEKLTLIYPFLTYATMSWYEHSSEADVNIHRDLLPYAKRLLNPATQNWVIWSDFYEMSPSNQGLSLRYKLDSSPHTVSTKLANPLYYASLLGLSDILADLTRQGLDVNAEGGTFATPLQAAIIHGHVKTVKTLLQLGANVTRRCGIWGSTLRAAAWRGNVEILRTLLSHGADPNMATSIGMYNPSALSTASSHGHVNAVRMLVEAGADVDQAVTHFGTPLMIALYHGHIDIMRVLVSKGAKLVVSDSDHARLMSEICLCGSFAPVQNATKIKSQQILARIVHHRPNLETESLESGPMTALISSEEYGATYDRAASVARIARRLLGEGLNSSRYAWDGLIALDIAMNEEDTEIGRLFLRYAALRLFGPFLEGLPVNDDPAHEDAGRSFAIDLQMAIFRNCHGEVEELLGENQTFNGSSTLGSALLIAVLTESVKITNLLLKHGVSVSYKSHTGRTALHYAALRGNLHIVTSLVNNGAETWCQDSAGNTPLLLAISRGQLLTTDIVKHLAIRDGFGQLPNPSGLLIETWKDMVGVISGHYEYNYGNQDPIEFEIYAWTEQGEIFSQPPFFTARGKDVVGGFEIYGQLFGDDGIIWAKLYTLTLDLNQADRSGWLYKGRFDYHRRSIKGTWHNSISVMHGTFALERRSVN